MEIICSNPGDVECHKTIEMTYEDLREGGAWSWLNFKYERLRNFCFVCGILGHTEKDCSVVYSNPNKEVEHAYRIWLRAPS